MDTRAFGPHDKHRIQEKMTDYTIGVDISKTFLDVHLLPDGITGQFTNDRQGFREMIEWIGNRKVARVVFEPTGAYHRHFEDALSKAGLPLSKINPLQARRFAQARGTRAKTDTIDAEVLAVMGVALQPGIYTVPSKNLRDLKALQIARQALIKDRTAAKNRSKNLTLTMLRRQNANRLRQIERDLASIEGEMLALINTDKKMVRIFEILCSIPGIAEITAATLMVEIPELGTLTSKAVANLSGLAPFARESGKWKGRRSIGGGRKFLREALYMPALVALRFNPDMKAKYHSLKDAQKPSKVAITAIMRKLIILANALVKNDRLWVKNIT
jgi:transposase